MKTLLQILLLAFPGVILAQNNNLKIISFSQQYNINSWLPLDEASRKFQENGGEIKVSSWKTSIGVTLFGSKQFPVRMGVSYMKINHTVVNRIKSFTYKNYYSDLTYTHIFTDPIDIQSKSHNFGVFVEPMWKVINSKKSLGLIGLNASAYFLEFYKSEYVTTDKYGEFSISEFISRGPLVSENNEKFGLASSSLELFYLHHFNFNSDISLGLKASFGANVYSNWDQFKRYGWVGLGLELGFIGSKKKENTVPVLE